MQLWCNLLRTSRPHVLSTHLHPALPAMPSLAVWRGPTKNGMRWRHFWADINSFESTFKKPFPFTELLHFFPSENWQSVRTAMKRKLILEKKKRWDLFWSELARLRKSLPKSNYIQIIWTQNLAILTSLSTVKPDVCVRLHILEPVCHCYSIERMDVKKCCFF